MKDIRIGGLRIRFGRDESAVRFFNISVYNRRRNVLFRLHWDGYGDSLCSTGRRDLWMRGAGV